METLIYSARIIHHLRDNQNVLWDVKPLYGVQIFEVMDKFNSNAQGKKNGNFFNLSKTTWFYSKFHPLEVQSFILECLEHLHEVKWATQVVP